jgi:hypothetical protein
VYELSSDIQSNQCGFSFFLPISFVFARLMRVCIADVAYFSSYIDLLISFGFIELKYLQFYL